MKQMKKLVVFLTYGIVPSRLPQEVVDFDIATIEKLGVTFKFNETIDATRLEELKAEYDAVFVGTGLWKSKVIDIPGKDLDGVVSAIDFLKDARLNKGKHDSWRYCFSDRWW